MAKKKRGKESLCTAISRETTPSVFVFHLLSKSSSLSSERRLYQDPFRFYTARTYSVRRLHADALDTQKHLLPARTPPPSSLSLSPYPGVCIYTARVRLKDTHTARARVDNFLSSFPSSVFTACLLTTQASCLRSSSLSLGFFFRLYRNRLLQSRERGSRRKTNRKKRTEKGCPRAARVCGRKDLFVSFVLSLALLSFFLSAVCFQNVLTGRFGVAPEGSDSSVQLHGKFEPRPQVLLRASAASVEAKKSASTHNPPHHIPPTLFLVSSGVLCCASAAWLRVPCLCMARHVSTSLSLFVCRFIGRRSLCVCVDFLPSSLFSTYTDEMEMMLFPVLCRQTNRQTDR